MSLLANPVSSIIDGRTTVTTAGTAVPLSAATTPVIGVLVQALSSNTNPVEVGASTVVASASTQRGIRLSAGQTVSLDVRQLSGIYVDSVTNGEGVSFIAGVA